MVAVSESVNEFHVRKDLIGKGKVVLEKITSLNKLMSKQFWAMCDKKSFVIQSNVPSDIFHKQHKSKSKHVDYAKLPKIQRRHNYIILFYKTPNCNSNITVKALHPVPSSYSM